MARTLHRLSATKVAAAKRAGCIADGGNLYLRVASGGTRGWIFRFTLGVRRAMLGSALIPPLASRKRREEAARWRRLIAAGIDPIAGRNEERAAAAIASAKAITFAQCAEAFITSHETGSNTKDRHSACSI